MVIFQISFGSIRCYISEVFTNWERVAQNIEDQSKFELKCNK